MVKEIFKWFMESLGPGIAEPEPYELSVTDELREQARGMVVNGDDVGNKIALKILLAFQLDSEEDRKILHRRLRIIEKHWIFRRATLIWLFIILMCIGILVWQHSFFLELPLPFFALP